jgi:hypothetical protein
LFENRLLAFALAILAMAGPGMKPDPDPAAAAAEGLSAWLWELNFAVEAWLAPPPGWCSLERWQPVKLALQIVPPNWQIAVGLVRKARKRQPNLLKIKG